jgi:hypothetical protein
MKRDNQAKNVDGRQRERVIPNRTERAEGRKGEPLHHHGTCQLQPQPQPQPRPLLLVCIDERPTNVALTASDFPEL